MSKAWASGSTSRWRRVRAAVLLANQMAAGGQCQAGVAGVCTGLADTVHHTLGRAVTGDDMRYLIAVCRSCNLHIGEPGRHSPTPKIITKW